MLKVLLICSQGASTGVLCDKIKRRAEDQNVELDISAVSIAQSADEMVKADVILLGPQIRYMLNKIKQKSNGKPVQAIDMQTYGTMNAEKVLEQIMEMIGA